MNIRTIKLIVGTNEKVGKALLKREFKEILWLSDNMETLAHYYEGCAIEIEVKLDPDKEMDYIRNIESDEWLITDLPTYQYGFIDIICPEGAIWYSFSEHYLKTHVISVTEIFPDLSEFNEEDY